MDPRPELREQRRHGYETERGDVLAHIPTTARNILELGCSTGALGGAVKRRQAATVLGVELDRGYAAEAGRRLDRVVVSDAETFSAAGPPDEAPFDCLVVADVLEHLVDPWTVLGRVAVWLAPGAAVVLSLPNVLWWQGLRRVVRERSWPREAEGVFDATHLRWFSVGDAQAMLRGAGLEPEAVEPRFWSSGRRLALVRRLHGLPQLAPYLAPQHILTARKPAG